MQKHENLIKLLEKRVNPEIIRAEHTNRVKNWRHLNYTQKLTKIYLIEDGVGWIKVNNQEYYPKAGDIVLLPEGVKQSYSYTDTKNTYSKYWINSIISPYDTGFFNMLDFPNCIATHDKFALIKKDFILLQENWKRKDLTSTLMTKSIIIKILSGFFSLLDEDQIEIKNDSNIQKIKIVTDYISDNIEKKITVPQMAELLHFHPNYFIKYFKKNTGMTPHNYILDMRLKKAEEMLLSNDWSIADISEKNCFNDIYHFSKSFKERYGLSPKKYRNYVLNKK